MRSWPDDRRHISWNDESPRLIRNSTRAESCSERITGCQTTGSHPTASPESQFLSISPIRTRPARAEPDARGGRRDPCVVHAYSPSPRNRARNRQRVSASAAAAAAGNCLESRRRPTQRSTSPSRTARALSCTSTPGSHESHPDEDFAETFRGVADAALTLAEAVRGLAALKKLEYMDDVDGEIGGKTPLVTTTGPVEPIRPYPPDAPSALQTETQALWFGIPTLLRSRPAPDLLRRDRAHEEHSLPTASSNECRETSGDSWRAGQPLASTRSTRCSRTSSRGAVSSTSICARPKTHEEDSRCS